MKYDFEEQIEKVGFDLVYLDVENDLIEAIEPLRHMADFIRSDRPEIAKRFDDILMRYDQFMKEFSDEAKSLIPVIRQIDYYAQTVCDTRDEDFEPGSLERVDEAWNGL